MQTSSIEWTEASWNPTTGCTKVSPGCDHCYAETFAERWRGVPGHVYEHGFDLMLRPERLEQPLRWTKPRRIFVNSMSDLFHVGVPATYLRQVWDVMSRTPQHTYQILTKRAERMEREVKNGSGCWADDGGHEFRILDNVWLGVSVETPTYYSRIRHLQRTPAAVRFLSCEPLLAALPDLPLEGIDWVICGGESGHGARPMHPAWVRDIRDQCQRAGVAFFFKQWGEWAPAGKWYDTTHCRMIAPDGTLLGAPWSGWRLGTPDYEPVRRFGKKTAGRVIDGRTWDEMPVRDGHPMEAA
jgi:protein gp37